MPRHIDGWSMAWARLSHDERRKRMRAEFCEFCAAPPATSCTRKNKTTLYDDYMHAARFQSALNTFNKERASA